MLGAETENERVSEVAGQEQTGEEEEQEQEKEEEDEEEEEEEEEEDEEETQASERAGDEAFRVGACVEEPGGEEEKEEEEEEEQEEGEFPVADSSLSPCSVRITVAVLTAVLGGGSKPLATASSLRS